MTKFVYTPRTGKKATVSATTKTIDFSKVKGWNSITELLAAVAGGLSFRTLKTDKDGKVVDSVCLRLFGSVQWEKIEELRRSDEFHAAVKVFAAENEKVDTDKWPMDQTGRKDNASNGKTKVSLSLEIPDGYALDGSREEAVVLKETDVSAVDVDGVIELTYKVQVRKYTPEESISRISKLELGKRYAQIVLELEELKAQNQPA